ncbi:hypothetical protein W97_03928 [Coniosporium apollinis CBS 100218]|uniref:Large ribosomal subunit protein bL28m n=1 Tax=Coniosporium apollinis (strain CBS 100218) TaxID=1168221 RepID=R7YS12_CONA1|nr:uncharacterized protein W97_03928 [Coniosporium apollinis CBS 100218]EON64695.1 hypothetical protein W97_03928 [Coniosporium apollinis CBS 100218]
MILRSSTLPFSHLRAFSTSSTLCAKSTKSKLLSDHANVPPYPYGPNLWYKQSNHGLYGTFSPPFPLLLINATNTKHNPGGAMKQFGNNISERTEIKTRRTFKPNIVSKRMFSKALNRMVRVRVSTRVLRTIDKVGGLDEYLLGEKAGRIKELGMKGWLMRWRIMQTEAVRERFREQRRLLGLPDKEVEMVGMMGEAVGEAEMREQIAGVDRELDEEERRMPGEEEVIEEGEAQAGFMQEEPAGEQREIVSRTGTKAAHAAEV